jgi:hypothetical protein
MGEMHVLSMKDRGLTVYRETEKAAEFSPAAGEQFPAL